MVDLSKFASNYKILGDVTLFKIILNVTWTQPIRGFFSFNWIFMWFKNNLINEGKLLLETET